MADKMNNSYIWTGNNYDGLIKFFNWDTTLKNSYNIYCAKIDDIITTCGINVGDKVYYYMQYCTSLILNDIDVLVDGKFIEELKDISLKFRGSSNQRIIDMNKTRELGEITLLYD